MPLNAMCSSRCEMPCSFGFSSRPPTPAQTPSAAVSRCGMVSVTTVRPDGKLGDFDAHPATPCFAARLTDSTNRSTSAWIVLHHLDVLGFGHQPVEPGRQLRPHAAGRLDRIGEFRRMRGRQHDVGNRRVRGVAIGDRERHRGMGIDEIAGLAPGGADRGRGFGLVGAAGVELLADRGEHRIRQHEAAGLLQRRHQPAHAGGIAPAGLEQQPLEIRGDLDVHRGRGRGVHLAHLVDAGLQRARQDVVDVGGDAQAVRTGRPMRLAT